MSSPKMISKLEYCVLKRIGIGTYVLLPHHLGSWLFMCDWIGGGLGVMAGVSRGVYTLCTVLFG